jgi:beta-glucanase (GH16 family)
MKLKAAALTTIFLLNILLIGCGGGSSYGGGGGGQNPPPVPTGLVPTATPGQVALTWTISSGATSYKVGRSLVSGGPYPTIASPSTNTYTDTGLTNGTAYYYVVAAVNAYGTSANSAQVSATPAAATLAAAPSVSTKAAQNGAVIVSLASTTAGATVYYTVDGSTPTTASQMYEAPFLVAANLTVNAIAAASGYANSTVTNQSFSPSIPSGTLVWSDEFSNTSGSNAQPDPTVWTYDTGGGGFGNSELETYCAWGSNASPCSAANPSEFVGTDGYLHIEAQQPSAGVYTSARMKTQGLFSYQYGRLEFRTMVPEAQGFWPANWLLGNNIATVNWPACGEMDVLERVNAALNPDWNEGSVHGTGFTGGTGLGTQYNFPSGQTAAQWHTYGMIWSPGSVSYYVDNPAAPYATFTPSSISGFSGATWPFDAGQSNFIILNLAIGGSFPGPPNGSTPFPSEMLIDYVRIYTN